MSYRENSSAPTLPIVERVRLLRAQARHAERGNALALMRALDFEADVLEGKVPPPTEPHKLSDGYLEDEAFERRPWRGRR